MIRLQIAESGERVAVSNQHGDLTAAAETRRVLGEQSVVTVHGIGREPDLEGAAAELQLILMRDEHVATTAVEPDRAVADRAIGTQRETSSVLAVQTASAVESGRAVVFVQAHMEQRREAGHRRIVGS